MVRTEMKDFAENVCMTDVGFSGMGSTDHTRNMPLSSLTSCVISRHAELPWSDSVISQ